MRTLLLKTLDIIPSQNFVKPDTIRRILDGWLNHNKQGLPPKPLVKMGGQGKYIAIDGHNLLVISDLFYGECEVFLVEGTNDVLTIEDSPGASAESVAERNRELKEKFFIVDERARQTQAKGITSINDLRLSAPYLENVERARTFLDDLEWDERMQ